MSKNTGWCFNCKREFSLAELRTGRCPYPDCCSLDIYVEVEEVGRPPKYIERKVRSDECRSRA